MITEKERQFIHYWEQAREQRKGFANRVFSGLPMAFLFFMPILLSLLTIYFFFPDWFTKISNVPTNVYFTVFVAILICCIFFSYFRMQYKWEMNEQLYKELKKKENKPAASAII